MMQGLHRGLRPVNRIAKRKWCRLTKFRHLSTLPKNVPDSADVVVIGGGSIGASVHYHLAKLGYNPILLEQNQLTAGTTWHSAGMLWRLRPSDVEIELHTYTRELLIKLEKQTDTAAWTENGGLYIAANKERLAEYKRLYQMGQYYDIESRIIGPEHIADIHPLISTEDMVGGLYSPTDGTIDPTGAVTAYSKAAKSLGGIVLENTGVAAISTKPGFSGNQITGVTTTCGHHIKTSVIVNAAGAWANEVSKLAGALIPLLPMKHAFVLTEALPGMHKDLPNVRDHDLSIYLKTQGDSMAIGGYETNPEFLAPLDIDFAFGLYNLDWDTFEQNFEGHIKRCPSIADTGITSTVCGPESFTPDHKPLCGPQPGVDGLFQACGFNSMGMMLGGGIGREMANWVDTGSAKVDLFSFDIARFHPSTISNATWVKDRTHESYAKTYAVVFPHDEPLAGRTLQRTSPLHAELQQQGCVYQSRHGLERPGWFASEVRPVVEYDYYGAYETGGWRLGPDCDDVPKTHDVRYLEAVESELTFDWPASQAAVAQEVYACRHGAAIFDQYSFGNFMIEGPQAHAAVQWVCTADMNTKKLGDVSYTTLCNANGGVEADLTIAKLKDQDGELQYYVVGGGATVTKDLHWIRQAVKQFDCSVTDLSETTAVVSIQGPHSVRILNELSDEDMDDTASTLRMPFSTCREAVFGGIDTRCLRLTFVGEQGFELHCAAADAVSLYKSIQQVARDYGAKHNVPIADAGYRAMDTLSAEKSFRHWHADLTNIDTPMEAGIGFTVLPKLKGDVDFLGRAALELHKKQGLQKRLVCLVVDDPSVMLHGMEAIFRNGVCVGLVKSTAYGHSIEGCIAHGYAKRPEEGLGEHSTLAKWLKAGDWAIGDRGTLHPASFHSKPPYDPTNSKLKEH
eukprot:m.53618 g.53618  ORF g.53618 m.53618 type:complete len:908 (+) comp21791_c0_seq2:183-2906(+)